MSYVGERERVRGEIWREKQFVCISLHCMSHCNLISLYNMFSINSKYSLNPDLDEMREKGESRNEMVQFLMFAVRLDDAKRG
jgi:hypothetical protein